MIHAPFLRAPRPHVLASKSLALLACAGWLFLPMGCSGPSGGAGSRVMSAEAQARTRANLENTRQVWRANSEGAPTLVWNRMNAAEPDVTYVLLHGWCEHRHFWALTAAGLREQHPSANVWSVDLPGHGESSDWSDPGNPRAMAVVIANWLLANRTGPLVLVGHNYGANVALETAHRLQEQRTLTNLPMIRGVVAMQALYDPSEAYKEGAYDLFAEALEANFEAEMKSFGAGLLTDKSHPATREWVAAEMSKARPSQAIPVLQALGGYDLRPTLRELRVPVRAINGAQPPIKREVTDAMIADFDAILLDGLAGRGYAPMLQAPDACVAALMRCAAEFAESAGGQGAY